ncbi:MAG: FAD-binding oxidoreductase [Betaproteobacteria bacterium]
MQTFDAIVIGGGVIGVSIAYHLSRLGCPRVLLLERGQLGGGTTAQSSCIIRTHYSVPQNVVLAQRGQAAFSDFAGYLEDPEADAGFNRCGLMIVAGEGARAAAMRETLAVERGLGIDARELTIDDARRLHPLLQLSDIAAVGWEPDAGYADAYLALTAFARNARRLGATLREGVEVTGLTRDDTGRVTGVTTAQGPIGAGVVISAQNIWSRELAAWTGVALPLTLSRHAVFTLEAPVPYTRALPVLKDLASPGKLYMRGYGGTQLLVGDGNEGETIAAPDTEQADVPLDYVAEIGEQVAHRMPVFAEAGLASSWTGVYDVTPDWNPVLGALPGIDGLQVAYGFSGHGFKLSPVIGRLLAQSALGLPTDIDLAPYSLSRFAAGELLAGRYGAGAVS